LRVAEADGTAERLPRGVNGRVEACSVLNVVILACRFSMCASSSHVDEYEADEGHCWIVDLSDVKMQGGVGLRLG